MKYWSKTSSQSLIHSRKASRHDRALQPRQLRGPPRSPATSPAQYPAGSGLGVSVLLRQPHGFEGLGVVPEEIDRDDPAVPDRGDSREFHVHLRALPAPYPTKLAS